MPREEEVQVVRQKRVSRGRGGVKKKRSEQKENEEEEDYEEYPGTVTVSRSEWEELSEMKPCVREHSRGLLSVKKVRLQLPRISALQLSKTNTLSSQC